MYLKSLEMTGFKSFAERTKLLFEPGLIAIVGPNGCGKSNVSDAIRWVLGEQRPTALRGSKMLDVIFNGTDQRKAMNMAEVSITFADCDRLLDLDFNEVTITRRVFRSGESAYFVNKNQCRLKDIQRMFMGTGIGTTSYSVMAQGQIDAILSSRPEDRRLIFEEAAGITKFKADRKEALRKLEQTEANLLRLADVIREVKRQIGSLQRQAARARRYQELKQTVRGLDIFVTRRKLAALDTRLQTLDDELSGLASLEIKGQNLVAEAETATAGLHAAIRENEQRIGETGEAAAEDESRLNHAGELIKLIRQRIAEYRSWSERDAREASEAEQQIGTVRERLAELERERLELAEQLKTARSQRELIQRRVDEERRQIEELRRELQAKRSESMERERRAVQLQNGLAAMESRQRSAHVQRERLAAEHAQLQQTLTTRREQHELLTAEVESLRQQAEAAAEALAEAAAARQETLDEVRAAQEESGRLQAQRAAKVAQIDLLTEQESRAESFQSGSRMLLDSANPLQLEKGVVLGPLAGKFKASAEYRPALEAVLRAWIDAVVLRHADDAPVVLQRLLNCGGSAASRLVAAAGTPPPAATTPPPAGGLTPLADHIQVADDFAEAAALLLHNVFIAGTLDAVPSPLPPGYTVVTLAGAVFRGNGCYELWMPEGSAASPLSRRMAISDAEEQVVVIEAQLAQHRNSLTEIATRQQVLQERIVATQRQLDASRRLTAQKEGEWQSVSRETERTEERIGVVAAELELAVAQSRAAEAEQGGLGTELERLLAGREEFNTKIQETQELLQEREADFSESNQTLTEARIDESNLAQQVGHLANQREIYEGRIAELQRQIEGRSQGVEGHDANIVRLEEQIAATEAQLEPLRQRAEESRQRLEERRRLRDGKSRELAAAERELTQRRQSLEQLRSHHSSREVELAEGRVRRQNQFDRILTEYKLSAEEFVAASDPSWGSEGEPPLPTAEARLARLNEELSDMGPVNLVAIEEYSEHEERYALLKAQEEDLLKSKEQIVDLLRMINKKSSEMFSSTFEEANANFEAMFTKLFNGGTAKLVLIENEEDPLECGIEVIARPPGKRLQSISLLSGGERTMTAVSLLFAIYMIKPSPFCILDELDAMLDDSNIGRFVQAIKDFLTQALFVIITHNQHTIASSDIVYGVTMPEKGVSKVLSMRLPDIGTRELEIGTEANES